MSDVRISCHRAKTKNANFLVVAFHDDLQNLIGTKYVILWKNDGKLFFKPSETKVKGSLKLNRLINVWSKYEQFKSFEGEYSLEYDNLRKMYYVDKDKVKEITRQYSNSNVPHPNYKAHINEPYVIEGIPENIITTVDNSVKVPIRKYSMTVYDGLLELLRVQIQDLNKSAVSATLDTIKSLIEDE